MSSPLLIPLGYKLRDEFCCPITRSLMSDPVLAGDGHTYDRTAIERWLRSHKTSPKNNDPLPHQMVVPNHNLKRLLEDMLKEGGKGLYCVDEDFDEEEMKGDVRIELVKQKVSDAQGMSDALNEPRAQ